MTERQRTAPSCSTSPPVPATERSIAFPLGRAGVSQTGASQGRLFGRAAEMAEIASAFERVRATGLPEVVLVSGEAGVGKSALVDQWARAWLPKEIHLAAGKSEKLHSDVPYAPFAKALRAAMLHILGESALVLNAVRARLSGSLAGSSRLLIDLVPETEFVLGASPPLPDVPSNFAQARTARAILLACAALGTQGRPFVLFLDDLQWLDEASLHVVRAFLETPPQNVLLIGSYRAEDMALSGLGGAAIPFDPQHGHSPR